MKTVVIPSTYDELVEHYDHYIAATIRKVSRGNVRTDDMPDLKQAVYARLIEQRCLDKYDPAKGAFSTYLYWVVRSVVVNQFDRNTRNPLNMAFGVQASPGHRRRDTEDGRIVLDSLLAMQDAGWEGQQVTRDLLRRLRAFAATAKNGAELTRVLSLLYEGRTPGEVAGALGRTTTTVAGHRRKLRAILEDDLQVAG